MARASLAPMEDPDRRRRAIPVGRRAGRRRPDRPGPARVQGEAVLDGHARRARADHPHATAAARPRPGHRRRDRAADQGVHAWCRATPGRTMPTVSWENDESEGGVRPLLRRAPGHDEQPLRVIRIEADGYLPAISRRMKDDEEEAVVHFALKRGRGDCGRRPPARWLAAGRGRGDAGHLRRGRRTSTTAGPPVGESTSGSSRRRADGRFDLPPQDPPYTIVVLHDRGYAVREVNARPTAPTELTVLPWSRVEGTLRFGGRPGAGQQLSLSAHRHRGTTSPGADSRRPTPRGDSRFERVVPGEVQDLAADPGRSILLRGTGAPPPRWRSRPGRRCG